MKEYGGVDLYIQIFLTSALAAGEWSASRPCRFTPGTRCIGGWVGPRVGLDDVEKRKSLTLSGLELRILGRYTDCAITAPLKSAEPIKFEDALYHSVRVSHICCLGTYRLEHENELQFYMLLCMVSFIRT
jgi:hypothetical protein